MPSKQSVVAADPPLADIEHSLSLIVRQATMGRIHNRLCHETGVQLERARYLVLVRVLDHGPIRLSDLSQLLNIDVSTASRQVAQLEQAGYLRRQPDASDRRASAISITPPGARLVRRVREAWRGRLADILSDWTPNDRELLGRLLDRLATAIVTYVADEPATSAGRR